MAIKQYYIQSGQSIFDVSVNIYGDVSLVYDLIQINSDLISDVTADLSGLTINYDDEKIGVSPFFEPNITPVSSTKVVTITNGQTLFDLALQLYGDISKTYELITLNSDKISDITFNDLTGIEIEYVEQKNETTEFYKSIKETLSTRLPEIYTREGYLQTDDGVDLMTDDGLFITVD